MSDAIRPAGTPPAQGKKRSGEPAGRASPLMFAAIVVVLIVIAYNFSTRSLADRLARRGWVLYVMPGCPHCRHQQETLGTDRYPLKVVCVKRHSGSQRGVAIEPATLSDTAAPRLCAEVGAYPFWINRKTGATREGYQDATQLVSMVQ